MREKELIKNLRKLREIRPSKDWVVLTKNSILRETEMRHEIGHFIKLDISFLFGKWKAVLVPVLSVIVLMGIFGFAQNTMPGDWLYSVKKAGETTQVTFSSKEEAPKVCLQIANKRLEDLNKLAEANRVKDLAPTIEDFQYHMAAAVEGLKATSSDPKVIKEIVKETQKLKENKEKVEAILGTTIGETEELDNALNEIVKELAEKEIKYTEDRSLTEKQQEILNEAKKNYNEGNFWEALEKILSLSQ